MRVSIVRCGGYNRDAVYEAVREMLAGLGGIESFVRPGMSVYIKPNMLGRHAPDEAITTHPEVVGAVARLCREAGAARVLIGDCPGGAGGEERIRRCLETCGYEAVAQREQAETVINRQKTVREVPNGGVAKSFELVREMTDAGVLISISKCKTHQLCAFTGAVKNLYGTIFGNDKRKYHAIYSRPTAFNHFLIDIAETVKPALHIMDAVVGIEGPGPAAGYPRKLGALLASASPYALDAAAVRLIGWKQSDVLLLGLARERGLLPGRFEDIELVGAPLDELRLKKPFMKPTMTGQAAIRLEKLLPKPIREALNARPFVNRPMCVGCAECMRACPPKAIVMQDKKPVIDYEKCIRCFCCQELCPEKAMEARKGFFR